MARPIKLGLDYFPMDTNVLKNIKIRRLMKNMNLPECCCIWVYYAISMEIHIIYKSTRTIYLIGRIKWKGRRGNKSYVRLYGRD